MVHPGADDAADHPGDARPARDHGGLVLDHQHRDEPDLRLKTVYRAHLEMVHRFAHRPPPPLIHVEGVAATQLVNAAGRVVSATERVRGSRGWRPSCPHAAP
ncbi:hypothetical protein [Nonomuraea maheshkhaliensis]|uniref:hypothetical protein n=1 Tax=Nonomuraea maheshkhaliensis TaxID=419590 RepID=UPI0031F985AA